MNLSRASRAFPPLLACLTLMGGRPPALRAAEPPPARRLQALVDAAQPGAVVRAPKGVYRETLTLNKPIQLVAEPGAEIRGSDVWTDWKPVGGGWLSAQTLPKFSSYGPGKPRSQWPEQAFVDGKALEQVAADPKDGQFAVDAARHVVLGGNPDGRQVEITVRTQWIVAQADDVTIEGFRMAHAANPPQGNAPLATANHARWTLRRCTFSDAHGAVVSLSGAGHQLLDCAILRGGQLGLHLANARDCLIRGNRINGNNTESFEAGWEAGGLKATNSENIRVENNEAASNRGPGVWFDIHCRHCEISGNRLHHNYWVGIFWEISDGASIHDNRVWENGWGYSVWGWGAGILVASSANAEVSRNLVAWNADGICVLSQQRGDAPGPTVGNFVHDNTVVGTDKDPQDPAHNNVYAIAFLQDWAGVLGQPESRNRAENNLIALPQPEGGGRFSFPGVAGGGTLEAFNHSPGSKGNKYLPESSGRAALKQAGMPTQAEGRRRNEE